MARYDADGGQVPRTLFEAAAFHRSVQAACAGCGHIGVFHAAVAPVDDGLLPERIGEIRHEADDLGLVPLQLLVADPPGKAPAHQPQPPTTTGFEHPT
jgi:hypothetical protein